MSLQINNVISCLKTSKQSQQNTEPKNLGTRILSKLQLSKVLGMKETASESFAGATRTIWNAKLYQIHIEIKENR